MTALDQTLAFPSRLGEDRVNEGNLYFQKQVDSPFIALYIFAQYSFLLSRMIRLPCGPVSGRATLSYFHNDY